LSLRVPAGTVAAFVGPSGAGKSTLMALMERFYDPQEGSVTIDGVDLKTVSGSSLRRQIGIVQQVRGATPRIAATLHPPPPSPVH
jgi:ABC-type multidrug transport system fused ATPase/permease subunit